MRRVIAKGQELSRPKLSIEQLQKEGREAWLAIKDQVELNCAEQALMDEVMRFQ